ncbi:6668_t:CDS:2, partial [Funneliformis caledonium]
NSNSNTKDEDIFKNEIMEFFNHRLYLENIEVEEFEYFSGNS